MTKLSVLGETIGPPPLNECPGCWPVGVEIITPSAQYELKKMTAHIDMHGNHAAGVFLHDSNIIERRRKICKQLASDDSWSSRCAYRFSSCHQSSTWALVPSLRDLRLLKSQSACIDAKNWSFQLSNVGHGLQQRAIATNGNSSQRSSVSICDRSLWLVCVDYSFDFIRQSTSLSHQPVDWLFSLDEPTDLVWKSLLWIATRMDSI